MHEGLRTGSLRAPAWLFRDDPAAGDHGGSRPRQHPTPILSLPLRRSRHHRDRSPAGPLNRDRATDRRPGHSPALRFFVGGRRLVVRLRGRVGHAIPFRNSRSRARSMSSAGFVLTPLERASARWCVDRADQLLRRAVDGLVDGGRVIGNGERLAPLETRFHHATLVVLAALAAVFVAEMDSIRVICPRSGSGRSPPRP